MSNNRGMTLIEIVVAIGIITILSSISFEVFKNIQPSLELSGATQDLITDIRYTQELAVAEQIIYGICFLSLDNKYQIVKYGTVEEILQEKLLPSGISFQEINGFSGDCIKFNPYGSVKESGNVVLKNIKNETKNIEIKPSGFSKIAE